MQKPTNSPWCNLIAWVQSIQQNTNENESAPFPPDLASPILIAGQLQWVQDLLEHLFLFYPLFITIIQQREITIIQEREKKGMYGKESSLWAKGYWILATMYTKRKNTCLKQVLENKN